jgi:hypothetical protein
MTSSIHKATAANAADEIPATEKMDSVDATTAPGNVAEDGFITVAKEKTW